MSANITALLSPITDALADRQRLMQLLQDHYCEHSSRFLLFTVSTIAVTVVLYYIFKEIYERRNQQDLRGKTVLITGGASGIGRMMANKLVKEDGCRVVIWDVHAENIKKTVEEVGNDPKKCRGYLVDICDYHKVYEVARQVETEMGPVDILINNAGIVNGKKILECTEKSLIDTVNVNLISHFWTVRAFLGGMKERGYGHIVTVASAAGIFGMKHLSDYAASKFGCIGFGESLRFEIKAEGYDDKVATTIVCPYFINTGMFDGVRSAHNLMPILEPEYVVDKIINGIKRKHEVVITPRMVYVGMLGKAVCPVWVVDYLMNFFTRDAMNGFKGRPHTKQE